MNAGRYSEDAIVEQPVIDLPPSCSGQQARQVVPVEVATQFDTAFPDVYAGDVFDAKCDAIGQHIFESDFGDGSSVYERAA